MKGIGCYVNDPEVGLPTGREYEWPFFLRRLECSICSQHSEYNALYPAHSHVPRIRPARRRAIINLNRLSKRRLRLRSQFIASIYFPP